LLTLFFTEGFFTDTERGVDAFLTEDLEEDRLAGDFFGDAFSTLRSNSFTISISSSILGGGCFLTEDFLLEGFLTEAERGVAVFLAVPGFETFAFGVGLGFFSSSSSSSSSD
jgi:hypothetical protein